MSLSRIKLFFTSSWLGHLPFCALALLATLAILWRPDAGGTPETLRHYAGIALAGAFLASALLMVVCCVYHTLRLRNLRALGNLCVWCLMWFGTWCGFAALAVIADVPPPITETDEDPIQDTATVHQPNERLHGPLSLVIPISTEDVQTATLEVAPNLVSLAMDYSEEFAAYISGRPSRWMAANTGDTFYTYPGHVVLEITDEEQESPQLVHAVFRTIVEGETLPEGFMVVSPGGHFPTFSYNGKEATPTDIALELGNQCYLLLACRGIPFGEPTRKALNAAITAVDRDFRAFAKDPDSWETNPGDQAKECIPGDKPFMHLLEPPSQFGIYQAELYVNTRTPGHLVVAVKDPDSDIVYRKFECGVSKNDSSQDPGKLFRFDIPSSMSESSGAGKTFPPNCPFFAISEGGPQHFFDAVFEVEFVPENNKAPREILLSRRYKVQSYDPPEPIPAQSENPGDTDTDKTPSPTAPGEADTPEPATAEDTPGEADTPEPTPAGDTPGEADTPEPTPAGDTPGEADTPEPTPAGDTPGEADTPEPAPADTAPAESPKEEAQPPAFEKLLGPVSLTMPISTQGGQTQTIAEAPHLMGLILSHADEFSAFISECPSRWMAADTGDTFYARPGHVVLQAEGDEADGPQLVHAVFRTILDGTALPAGFTKVRPGDGFPTIQRDGGETTPTDIALDLGQEKYLLLACRGFQDGEATRQAINAAIKAVDADFQVLAEDPTYGKMNEILRGEDCIPGDTQFMRLSEPPGQAGIYQAEIYANPQALGKIVVSIKSPDSGNVYRTFECETGESFAPADSHKLFRFDLPGSAWDPVENRLRTDSGETAGLFPRCCPFFAISQDTGAATIDVVFEVEFVPDSAPATKIPLLSRRYKVHPYTPTSL